MTRGEFLYALRQTQHYGWRLVDGRIRCDAGTTLIVARDIEPMLARGIMAAEDGEIGCNRALRSALLDAVGLQGQS